MRHKAETLTERHRRKHIHWNLFYLIVLSNIVWFQASLSFRFYGIAGFHYSISFPDACSCAIRLKNVAFHLFLSTQCGLKRSFIPFSTHLIYVLLNSSRTYRLYPQVEHLQQHKYVDAYTLNILMVPNLNSVVQAMWKKYES